MIEPAFFVFLLSSVYLLNASEYLAVVTLFYDNHYHKSIRSLNLYLTVDLL